MIECPYSVVKPTDMLLFQSPDGTKYFKLTVDNLGILTTTDVTADVPPQT